MVKKNKRGVQPVIATALLVGFAVTVTAVVMMFGTDYVENIQRKQGVSAQLDLDCTNVKFEVTSVTSAEISLQNSGSRDIDAFFLKYLSGNEVTQNHFPLHVPVGGYAKLPSSPVGGGASGEIIKVQIVAKIKGGDPGKVQPVIRMCGDSERMAKV
tara:strand:+ start:1205 stop:1672 length:468 start_codon:yes stop_codon:yes gene_type:complete